MEFIFALPILLLPVAFPFMAGIMAKRFGRSFRFWFWISFLIPFVSCIIILCLPDLSVKEAAVHDDSLNSQLSLTEIKPTQS